MNRSDIKQAVQTFKKYTSFSDETWERKVRNLRDKYTSKNGCPDLNYSGHFQEWFEMQVGMTVTACVLEVGMAVDQEGEVNGHTIGALCIAFASKCKKLETRYPSKKLMGFIKMEAQMEIEAQNENFINNIQHIIT